MFKTLFFFLLFALCVHHSLLAQESTTSPRDSNSYLRTFIGLGGGLPYGGFGMKLSQQLTQELDVFGGVGYNLVGVGYNVGLQVNIPSERRAQFFLNGMYGYNAVIKIKNLESSEKSYYGPSFGAGLKLKSSKLNGSYWDFALLVPVRSKEFKDDQDFYAKSPLVDNFTKAFPLLLSVGYNFQISADK